MIMRGVLPGCNGEDQAIATREAAEEAKLDEMVSVEVNLDIRRAEVREVVSMTRRRFKELEEEMDSTLDGLFLHVDPGNVDFEDYNVEIAKFAIKV